jgi:predicted XRE-type DNA-binding protein
MREEQKSRLEAGGWKVGSTEEFLGLTPEEAAYVDLRLKLSDAVRQLRQERHLTQVQLAELLHSSQSRIAKAEAADHSVSLDLLIRSLLAMGVSNRDLANVIASDPHHPPD